MITLHATVVHAAMASVWDFGPNTRAVLLTAVGTVAAYYSRKAYKQVTPNGGSSAVDIINAKLDAYASVLDDHSQQLTKLSAAIDSNTNTITPTTTKVGTQ